MESKQFYMTNFMKVLIKALEFSLKIHIIYIFFPRPTPAIQYFFINFKKPTKQLFELKTCNLGTKN